MTNSLLFLGLIKKAGKLELGAESVKAAAQAGKAALILSAGDASGNSARNAAELAGGAGVPHLTLPYTKAELGCVVGRGLPGMAAITEQGFAAAFTEKLTVDFPGVYEETAKALQNAAGAAAKPGRGAEQAKHAGQGKRRTKK